MTVMKRISHFVWLLLFVGFDLRAEPVHDGDLIFQTSRSAQSLAIQQATHSTYSHMGIIFHVKGKPYVMEAIKTVQYTPLEAWAARGEGGRYVVKRIRDADRLLTPEVISRLRHESKKLMGKSYDFAFGWSDKKIYCSELVWKIYDRALGMEIGRPQKLRDFDLSHPLVKMKIKERYGSRVPLDETAISPGEMFSFEGLEAVPQ
jgi:hypothetical protein